MAMYVCIFTYICIYNFPYVYTYIYILPSHRHLEVLHGEEADLPSLAGIQSS